MASKETKALATVADFSIAPIEGGFTYEELKEELSGLGEISFPRIKIPNGGVLQFERAADDDTDTEYLPELTGIIIGHHPVFGYWRGAYNPGATTPPDCSSLDGKAGIWTETGEVSPCASCKFNQFGSGVGNSKACKNGHRLYILQSGEALPVILPLPPTSLKSLNLYLTDLLLNKKQKPHTVVTRLKLVKPAKDSTYSKVQFSYVGPLPVEAAEGIKAYAESFKASAMRASARVEDYAQERVYADDEPPFAGPPAQSESMELGYMDGALPPLSDYDIPAEQ